MTTRPIFCKLCDYWLPNPNRQTICDQCIILKCDIPGCNYFKAKDHIFCYGCQYKIKLQNKCVNPECLNDKASNEELCEGCFPLKCNETGCNNTCNDQFGYCGWHGTAEMFAMIEQMERVTVDF